MNTEYNMPTSYEHAIKAEDGEKEMLFQRFNFFLVATAFLIAGYAVVVTSVNSVTWLSYALNAVGFNMAIFFLIHNYLTSLYITGIHSYIQKIEKGEPHKEFREEIVHIWPSNPYRVLIGFFIDLVKIVRNPLDSNRTRYILTWLIPLGFTTFWLLMWFNVLHPEFIHSVWFFIPLMVLATGIVFNSCIVIPLKVIIYRVAGDR